MGVIMIKWSDKKIMFRDGRIPYLENYAESQITHDNAELID